MLSCEGWGAGRQGRPKNGRPARCVAENLSSSSTHSNTSMPAASRGHRLATTGPPALQLQRGVLALPPPLNNRLPTAASRDHRALLPSHRSTDAPSPSLSRTPPPLTPAPSTPSSPNEPRRPSHGSPTPTCPSLGHRRAFEQRKYAVRMLGSTRRGGLGRPSSSSCPHAPTVSTGLTCPRAGGDVAETSPSTRAVYPLLKCSVRRGSVRSAAAAAVCTPSPSSSWGVLPWQGRRRAFVQQQCLRILGETGQGGLCWGPTLPVRGLTRPPHPCPSPQQRGGRTGSYLSRTCPRRAVGEHLNSNSAVRMLASAPGRRFKTRGGQSWPPRIPRGRRGPPPSLGRRFDIRGGQS